MTALPPEFDADVAARVSWTLRVDDLKQEMRQNPHRTGTERENVAAHCWHLAMAAMVWAPRTLVKVDVDRAVRLAVVHDFPELFTHDHSVYDEPQEDRRPVDELVAMRAFVDEAPRDFAEPIFDSWREFETKEGFEARFVMALDAALPILLNHANVAQSSWAVGRLVVHPDKVRGRVEQWIRPVLPELAEVALWLIDDAVERKAFSRAE